MNPAFRKPRIPPTATYGATDRFSLREILEYFYLIKYKKSRRLGLSVAPYGMKWNAGIYEIYNEKNPLGMVYFQS